MRLKKSPVGRLPVHLHQLRAQRSVMSMEELLLYSLFYFICVVAISFINVLIYSATQLQECSQ